MALARVQYTADGNTDTFSLTFPYLDKNDVKVSLDGEETTDFSWPSNSSLKLSSTPSAGVIVDIKRETERKSILVDFQDGSTLLESDLDLAARQSFYLAQESFDQTGSTLAVANDGSYSASDRRISLLGYPTQSQDAANKQYVDDVFADGNDAAAAANESENWANYPVDSLVPEGDQEDDYSALHHATKASEDAASASSDASSASSDASAASTSASNAAASESAAATSESNASSSESAAATSESNAQASANAAADSESAASTSASNAASSANTASTEAGNAADSASAAATSETNAGQSASNASTSATNAQNSEDAAATSESNAANSASAAATSESNAQSSEDDASDHATESQNWATTPEDTLVPEGDQVYDYSALHWSRKAEGWAQSLNLPSASGNGGKFLRQSSDESGFEYIDGLTASEIQSIASELMPVGAVQAFARSSAPTGWLVCDGSNVSRSSYSGLFNSIGTTFGSGDGSSTFNLPDLRGEFIRGWDDGRGADAESGRSFGSWQNDALEEHTHSTNASTSNPTNYSSLVTSTTNSAYGSVKVGSVAEANAQAETRPRNVALLYCIKY